MKIIGVVLSILAFSLLVLSHEFGHFLLAKLNGVYVEEFAMGLGPTLFGWQGKETKYSLKLFPFGGCCMMRGEDETDNKDPRAFGNKSVWARMSILFAGPFFNFIFAFLLALVVIGSLGIDQPVLSEVMEGYPAEAAGIQAGDRITELNGEKIHVYRDVSLYIAMHQGEDLHVTYERDGASYEADITPVFNEEYQSYMMGIVVAGTREKLSVGNTIRYSVYEVQYWMRYTLTSLKMMISGKVKASEVSGPVGMVSAMSDMVEESSTDGWFYIMINLFNICILLSANLGVLNLLPLPALDGGRLFFCLIELLRGKPVSPKYEAYVHAAGLILLLGLSVVILTKDVFQLFR